MRSLSSMTLFVAAVVVSVACNGQPAQQQNSAPADDAAIPAAFGEVIDDRIESEEETFRLVRVVGGLEHPWGLDFLPDGRMLVTERPGRLNIVDEDGRVTPLEGLPDIRAERQGGMLDVRLGPEHADDGWIYFTYSAPGAGGIGTELARGRLDGTRLSDVEILYSMEPKTDAGAHFGSRIAFPLDGTVVFTIGDRGEMDRAQDTMDPAGSTLRLNLDGSIPDDNPFVGQDGYLPELYTVGNRNSQGMDIHPETGEVWQTEHGPRGGDELNLIQPGLNYGWPEATWGVDYRTREQIGVRPPDAPQFEDPLHYWTPAIAPSGTVFYRGDAFPRWRHNLFVGSLVQEQLRRVVLDGHDVAHEEVLLDGQIGRIRYVTNGPDGNLYLLTDAEDGGVYRLEPARGN